jgi:hypothetical protein
LSAALRGIYRRNAERQAQCTNSEEMSHVQSPFEVRPRPAHNGAKLSIQPHVTAPDAICARSTKDPQSIAQARRSPAAGKLGLRFRCHHRPILWRYACLRQSSPIYAPTGVSVALLVPRILRRTHPPSRSR